MCKEDCPLFMSSTSAHYSPDALYLKTRSQLRASGKAVTRQEHFDVSGTNILDISFYSPAEKLN